VLTNLASGAASAVKRRAFADAFESRMRLSRFATEPSSMDGLSVITRGSDEATVTFPTSEVESDG